MAGIQLICPSCGASATPAQPIAQGQRVRCARCGAVFPAGDQGVLEVVPWPAVQPQPLRGTAQPNPGGSRPRPSFTQEQASKAGKRSVPLVVWLGGSIVLLGAVVTGIVLLVWMARGEGPPDAQVTVADLDKLDVCMTKDEVEALLGPGRQANFQDIHPNWIEAGRRCGATHWREWKNGENSLVVGFGQGKSGTPRAVISFFVHNFTRGQVVGQETKIGFLHLNPLGGDLDEQARERGKERALLKSPRWRKGPAIRKTLVGSWVAEFVGAYDFKEDGACQGSAPGDRFAGTYRFTDDEHIELILKSEPFVPGQQPQTRKLNCKVLVDDEELILIDEQFPRAVPTIYRRRK